MNANCRSLLLVTAAIIITALPAFSQSDFYFDENSDGSNIYTDVFSEPNYTNSCVSYVSAWSNLNNSYVDGGNTFYPNVGDLAQQAATGQQEIEFTWDFGVSIYTEILPTQCGLVGTISFEFLLGIAVTWAQTVQDNGSGQCTTIPDCAPGVTALCPQSNPQRWTVVEDDGGFCDPFHSTYWLTIRNGSGQPKTCSVMGLALAVPTGPGYCTSP